MGYDEEDEEISTDLWQEACWIVIRYLEVPNINVRCALNRILCLLAPTSTKRVLLDSSWILLMSSFRCQYKELLKTLHPLNYRLSRSMMTGKHRYVS